ncbi:MAG: YhcH/YjgK/YiaL family protein [Williamsia sp.]|nr:YhcH/YjgK/YiaL family protein [Williamsia sp.]
MNFSSCRLFLLVILSAFGWTKLAAQTSASWNKKTAAQWYSKHEWLASGKSSKAGAVQYDQFGRTIEGSSAASAPLRQLKPHPSIDQVQFAEEYHARKEWWDKAFDYLQNANLDTLSPGDHPIAGQDVFARVTEGPLKNIDSSRWEAHKNYHDVHMVIRGREKIGIGPLAGATLVDPYNSVRDISFYTGTGKYYTAEPGTYFIAFPNEIHRPGLEVDGKGTEKKIVIKIKSSKAEK